MKLDGHIWNHTLCTIHFNFLSNYLLFERWRNVQGQDIVTDLEDRVLRGKDIHKALMRVIAKHHTVFDGLFQSDDERDEVSDN